MVRPPWILKHLFNDLVWNIPTEEKVLYLSFDDGPHEIATPFVLGELKKYNAKATFFCIGKNVIDHPELYREIIESGHGIGNHTHNHLNGWKSRDRDYFDNILEARKYIDSFLFRPPYGRITPFQVRQLKKAPWNFEIIMWDVLSKDYDLSLTADQCTFNVLRHSRPGSVIVFHDSQKAYPRLQKALPATLSYFSEKGYSFRSIGEKVS